MLADVAKGMQEAPGGGHKKSAGDEKEQVGDQEIDELFETCELYVLLSFRHHGFS
jgi:hypothetical protein